MGPSGSVKSANAILVNWNCSLTIFSDCIFSVHRQYSKVSQHIRCTQRYRLLIHVASTEIVYSRVILNQTELILSKNLYFKSNEIPVWFTNRSENCIRNLKSEAYFGCARNIRKLGILNGRSEAAIFTHRQIFSKYY